MGPATTAATLILAAFGGATPDPVLAGVLTGLAPVLASLAVFFTILELKAPGIGVWTACAIACGVAFFACQRQQGMAGGLEAAVILFGFAAIAVELFLLPAGGLFGFTGGLTALVGLLLAFIPDDVQFRVGDPGFTAALNAAFLRGALALAALSGGLIWLIRVMPGSRAVDRIAATAEISATSAGTVELSGKLVGRHAVVRSDLRPSGFVTIDGNDLAALAEYGAYISAGTIVEIVAVRFGEAVVRPRVEPA